MAVWINAGVLLLNGAPQASSHDALGVPIWVGSLLLFCVVFVVLAVIAMTTDILRLRRRSTATPGEDRQEAGPMRVGTTMADGGKPVETVSDEELWANWDPEFLSLRNDSEDP